MANERRKDELSAKNKGPAYEAARDLAASKNLDERMLLATNPETPPEILFFLADDDDAKIRKAVASNTRTPRQADEKLAKDSDQKIRATLATKIAALTQDLDSERRSKVKGLTVELLESLAWDSASEVRAILAESIKNVSNAPPEVVDRVIKTLALDTELVVAGPVLQHSPMLNDDLLVELVASARAQGAVSAISRRDGVSESVSEAIVKSNDDDAIVELLRNDSAQIREDILDQLIEAAPAKTEYHEPLVRRPKLSSKNMLSLAKFVADALVDELTKREGLDASVVEELRGEMEKRLDHDDEEHSGEKQRAEALFKNGELNEKTMARAIASGRRIFVTTGLTLLSGLPAGAVHAMINSHSAKAIIAAAWKAGLTMETAVQLQLRIGQLSKDEVLRPKDDGSFPLSDNQLEWQIELATEDEE